MIELCSSKAIFGIYIENARVGVPPQENNFHVFFWGFIGLAPPPLPPPQDNLCGSHAYINLDYLNKVHNMEHYQLSCYNIHCTANTHPSPPHPLLTLSSRGRLYNTCT